VITARLLLLMMTAATMTSSCGAPIARLLTLEVLGTRAVLAKSRALLGCLLAVGLLGGLRGLPTSIRTRLRCILPVGQHTASQQQRSSESSAPKPVPDASFHDSPRRHLYTVGPSARQERRRAGARK